MLLSRALALLQHGLAERGLVDARKGRDLLEREGGRRYWIVGLESYWWDCTVGVTDRVIPPERES